MLSLEAHASRRALFLGLYVASDWTSGTFRSSVGLGNVSANAWGYFWGVCLQPTLVAEVSNQFVS